MVWCRSTDVLMQVCRWCDSGPRMVWCRLSDGAMLVPGCAYFRDGNSVGGSRTTFGKNQSYRRNVWAITYPLTCFHFWMDPLFNQPLPNLKYYITTPVATSILYSAVKLLSSLTNQKRTLARHTLQSAWTCQKTFSFQCKRKKQEQFNATQDPWVCQVGLVYGYIVHGNYNACYEWFFIL